MKIPGTTTVSSSNLCSIHHTECQRFPRIEKQLFLGCRVITMQLRNLGCLYTVSATPALILSTSTLSLNTKAVRISSYTSVRKCRAKGVSGSVSTSPDSRALSLPLDVVATVRVLLEGDTADSRPMSTSCRSFSTC